MSTQYRTDSMYRTTRFVNGGYLDIMDSSISSKEDMLLEPYTITPAYQNKPDKLAHELYGNARLWWVFAEFNPDTLRDPIVDFVSGLEIQIPTNFT